MSIKGSECSHLSVLFLDSQLAIFRSQLYLREHISTLQLIKQIIYSWEWVLVLHHHFIQLTIINAQMKCAILLLFFTNNTETPQGELLDRMKPLSNNFKS
jgi:hypothetical protein